MPTYNIRNTSVQDWRDTMMSKAEFNAVAKQESRNNAGSGFDEFGKHYSDLVNNTPVNEGLWTLLSTNLLRLGRLGASTAGTSKTEYPISNINGVITKIYGVNSSNVSNINDITLPPAPTVLPSTATLTQQQIDSGVIKHADASNSGLIVNGKFDTDTSGWTAGGSTALSIDAGRLKVVASSTTGTPNAIATSTVVSTVIGKRYRVEYSTSIGVNPSGCGVGAGTSSGAVDLYWEGYKTTSLAYGTFEFIATTTTSYILCLVDGSVTGTDYSFFDNIAVFPADAISRSDLVFLESWHEDVSEKDFVYPLGNVQYLGTTGDSGTPVAGAFAGAATYSLFSDTWQADSALMGKGYVWSTLSDANKKAFVANPENNCYLDGDKVIQVRYRMRVVMGLGDSWQGYDSQHTLDVYGTMKYAEGSYIQAKGDLISISSDYTLNRHYLGARSTAFITGTKLGDGMFALRADFGAVASYIAGDCFALPIALVHRRNTGMMHPVYNPNGTKLASDSLPWYSTTVSFTSIADCFTDSKLLTASGYIGTTTGRSDGIFYDQVHEGDITDLRVNSRGMNDYQRTSDKWMSKLQDGTYRGSEGEWNTITTVGSSNTDSSTVSCTVITSMGIQLGDIVYLFTLSDGNKIRGYVSAKSATNITIKILAGAISAPADRTTILGIPTTRTKSNTLTHTDIIGSPANYPTAWKQSGVSGVPLIVAEDGTSLLPTGTTGSDGLAVFKLSRPANATPLQVLKSTDSGATWTALTVTTHYTFSTTTNAITFTAGNIPLVADLIRVTYQTHTNMAVAAVNSEVLAIGYIWAGNYGVNNNYGKYLNSSLIGKIAIGSQTNELSRKIPLKSFELTNLDKLYNLPTSDQVLLTNSNNSPATKVFPYLTRSNGKVYLQLVFKEMKYGSYAAPTVVTAASATYTQNMTYKINIAGCALDGRVVQQVGPTVTAAVDWALYGISPTGIIYLLSDGTVPTGTRLYDGDSWGDDSKFNIVDNVSTTTDTNGATVLIGQKRVELPFFIGASE